MTPSEIDGLSGITLNEAVARHLGWTQPIPKVLPSVWEDLDGESLELQFASDIGSAMQLLLSIDTSENGLGYGWSVQECDGEIGVYSELRGEPIATGPKDQAASVLCRAFLKLKATP